MKNVFPDGGQESPLFDLSIENELLILKLRAEFGAECKMGTRHAPPEVLNYFLKTVYAFEKRLREPQPSISVFKKIGEPEFRKAAELGDKQVTSELKRLIRTLRDHQLQLDILGQYSDRQIYNFITEEFFHHELEDVGIPGYIHHFCYEDFHPNHELEIRSRIIEFFIHWFDRKVNVYNCELAETFVLPDTREFHKEEVIRKIDHVFESFVGFRQCECRILDVHFEWDEEQNTGSGHVEGQLSYDAITDEGETLHIDGAFEFFLSNTEGWWKIFYFVFPGFKW